MKIKISFDDQPPYTTDIEPRIMDQRFLRKYLEAVVWAAYVEHDNRAAVANEKFWMEKGAPK